MHEFQFQKRIELARIVEFAEGALPKFPAKGQTKLRQWAHEAYECELNDAWEGFKEPRAKALDQFILMRTIPNFGQRDIRPGPLSHAPRSSAVGTS